MNRTFFILSLFICISLLHFDIKDSENKPQICSNSYDKYLHTANAQNKHGRNNEPTYVCEDKLTK